MALNILIVDDSSVMRAIIIKTLRLSQLPLGEVHEATNGQEALKVLDGNWIDLALVDINMPVMTGEEMIDRLRQNPETADLPVIVVSTEGSETRRQVLMEKGAGFVHKPFTPETLRDAIVRTLGGLDEQKAGDGTLQGGYSDL
ncbi:MAG: two-component system response regulator [Deltaproteobacteria bacterium RBG_13_53_10]|nr:MAG: two-component system response regulator [Deltaproteobacteria bacterium RBG_13_53_10]